jgi:hypothetical protein
MKDQSIKTVIGEEFHPDLTLFDSIIIPKVDSTEKLEWYNNNGCNYRSARIDGLECNYVKVGWIRFTDKMVGSLIERFKILNSKTQRYYFNFISTSDMEYDDDRIWDANIIFSVQIKINK